MDFIAPWVMQEEHNLRIASCFQTTPEEVDSGRWNPYLGISINNRAFTPAYLDAFLQWAVPRSRDKVALVLVDILQRINNQVLDRSKPFAAIEKAFRKADELRSLCNGVLERLDSRSRDRVHLLEWPAIMDEQYFLHNLRLFTAVFQQDPAFREALMELSRQNLGAIAGRLGLEQLEQISHYILYELPELVTGFVFDGIHFNLNVYPGMIFKVYKQLQKQACYARIEPDLRIIGPFASVEAYLEKDLALQ